MLSIRRSASLGFLAAFILSLTLLTGCFFRDFSDDAGPAGAPQSAATIAALNTIIDNGLQTASAPGAIVGLWQAGYEPLMLARGKGDVVTGQPPSVTASFRMASNSKMFTAMAVLMLADQGKLSLDDKVSRYLPEVPHAGEFTIRQVANHSAGLPNFTEIPDFNHAVDATPLKKWTPSELLAYVRDLPLEFAPGSKYNYSNSGYIVLGMLVERVSGTSWERFVTEHIINVLGLHRTFCPTEATLPSDAIKGYENQDDGLISPTYDPSIAWSAGAMVTTLADMKIWLDAVREGRLLSPAMNQEHKTWIPMEETSWYGFGLINIRNTYLGHTGIIPGYNSFMFTTFDGSQTLLVLVNTGTGASEIAGDIIRFLAER